MRAMGGGKCAHPEGRPVDKEVSLAGREAKLPGKLGFLRTQQLSVVQQRSRHLGEAGVRLVSMRSTSSTSHKNADRWISSAAEG